MKIKLFDYVDEEVIVELDDKNISSMTMKGISGDEVLVVRYEDGTCKTYDSDSTSRTIDFDGGKYDIVGDEISKFLNERKYEEN